MCGWDRWGSVPCVLSVCRHLLLQAQISCTMFSSQHSLRVLLLALSFASIACGGASSSAERPNGVTISGKGVKAVTLSLADLERLPVTSLRAKDRGDGEYTFEGVELRHILAVAGVEFSDSLRGKTHTSSYLVVRGADAYQTLFTFTELDPSFSDDVVLLAFRRNGKPLPEADGPFRIVAPGEKRRARWVRGVSRLEIKALK